MEKGPDFGGYKQVCIHLNQSTKRIVFDPNDVDAVVSAMESLSSLVVGIGNVIISLKPDPAFAAWKKAVAEDRVATSYAEFKETYHGQS